MRMTYLISASQRRPLPSEPRLSNPLRREIKQDFDSKNHLPTPRKPPPWEDGTPVDPNPLRPPGLDSKHGRMSHTPLISRNPLHPSARNPSNGPPSRCQNVGQNLGRQAIQGRDVRVGGRERELGAAKQAEIGDAGRYPPEEGEPQRSHRFPWDLQNSKGPSKERNGEHHHPQSLCGGITITGYTWGCRAFRHSGTENHAQCFAFVHV